MIARWAVPDQSTAKRLFSTLAPSFEPWQVKHPHKPAFIIQVTETDDHAGWIVFERPPPMHGRIGEMFIQTGGGGLTMTIDKCSAAISEVHFQR